MGGVARCASCRHRTFLARWGAGRRSFLRHPPPSARWGGLIQWPKSIRNLCLFSAVLTALKVSPYCARALGICFLCFLLLQGKVFMLIKKGGTAGLHRASTLSIDSCLSLTAQFAEEIKFWSMQACQAGTFPKSIAPLSLASQVPISPNLF